MNPTHSRRLPARLLGLSLGSAAVALIPSVALGATSTTPSTITAAIGSNGSVQSVKQLAANGASSAFSGKLPLTMQIDHTAAGGTSTYTYHVANTSSQTQTVHYTDTAGNDRHTSVTLQLPLVAQLGVDVPASMSNIAATGATITTTSDGVRHVLWDMVLYSPLGSASQDVAFTATGSGTPVAELRATAVDSSARPGLSVAQQDATASYQQDDFWNTYAKGGAGGLDQLSSGTGQLVDGLTQLFNGATQLHSGLAGGLSGTNAAATGSTKLYNGSAQAYAGSKKLHNGSAQLTAGLAQIKGGLDQLGAKAGLPAAVGGLDQILAGIGSTSDAATVIGGVSCLKSVITDVVVGTNSNGRAGTADACYAAAGGKVLPMDPLAASLNTLVLSAIISPTSTAPSPIDQLLLGLTNTDPKHPGVLQGLQQIKAGLTTAVVGVHKLDAGAGAAHAGSAKITAGQGKLSGGLKQIRDGLQQLSSGLTAGAKSFPAAVDGAGQIADGLGQALDGAGKVHGGIDQVNSQAVTPLKRQLAQSSQNEHQKIAVLNAATALAASSPGGLNTTYVLSQNTKGFKLAADSGTSHTGRNVGIGLGGVGVLLVGMLGGFALGRQRRTVTTA